MMPKHDRPAQPSTVYPFVYKDEAQKPEKKAPDVYDKLIRHTFASMLVGAVAGILSIIWGFPGAEIGLSIVVISAAAMIWAATIGGKWGEW